MIHPFLFYAMSHAPRTSWAFGVVEAG